MVNGETDNEGNAIWKRCVLSLDLKILDSLEGLTDEGREFHICGLATKKGCMSHPLIWGWISYSEWILLVMSVTLVDQEADSQGKSIALW